MALNKAIVEITVPGSTGNLIVSGLPFKPQCVEIFGTSQSASGSTRDLQMSIGAFDSHGNQFATAIQSEDGLSTSNADRDMSNANCLIVIDTAGAQTTVAEFVSMESDGFVINFTDVTTTGTKFYCVCIGGITDIRVGTEQYKATPGTLAVNIATGHRPDALKLFAVGRDTYDTPYITSQLSIGMSDGISQFSMAQRSENGQGITNTDRYWSAAALLTVIDITTGVIDDQALLDSFDSNGYTLDWIIIANASRKYHYISYQGVDAEISQILQKTTTGIQATTGVGFEPEILFAMSHNTPNTGIIVSASGFYGAAIGVGATEQVAISCFDSNNKATSVAFRHQYLGRTLSYISTSATLYTAELDSFDVDGYTLDWTGTDGVARLFSVLSMRGTEPITPSPTTLPPTTLAPTTVGPTLPPTTLGPTTAPSVPEVLRRGISNLGFSFRDQWR